MIKIITLQDKQGDECCMSGYQSIAFDIIMTRHNLSHLFCPLHNKNAATNKLNSFEKENYICPYLAKVALTKQVIWECYN